MLQKINKAISSIMENGLFQFYTNFGAFQEKLDAREILGDEAPIFQPVPLESLQRPIKLILCLYGVALCLFLMEMMVHKWKNRKFVKIDDTRKCHSNNSIGEIPLFERSLTI